MGEGVVGAREFLFPRFLQWPKKFLAYTGGDLVGLVSRGHCPRGSWHHTSKNPLSGASKKRELRPPKQEAGTSMSRILIAS